MIVMQKRLSPLGLTFLGLAAVNAPGMACQLDKVAELPVIMNGLLPSVSARIDGKDVPVLLNSGDFFNLLTPLSATQLNLALRSLPRGMTQSAVGGQAGKSVTFAKDVRLGAQQMPPPSAFVVGASDFGSGASGVIGQNILANYDVEYDLGNGSLRLLGADGCIGTSLAYWATSQPYSVVGIGYFADKGPSIASASANGTGIRVQFDTGATHSILDLKTAARLGLTPQSPGVVEAGYVQVLGRGWVKTWVVQMKSFKIGDEELQNPKVLMGDLSLAKSDMLLGADFYLSHRIYVANSQHKLYFTYNGGPIFNLKGAEQPPAGSISGGASGPTPLTASR
jgi:hypothetical protein